MVANPQKEDGHVDIANEIVEALAKTYLSSYESQVLWTIFRKTYGWHKKEDWITNTQISDMTGIAESHTSRTIKRLIQRKIIIRVDKKLAFQKDYDQWEKLPKGVTSHHEKSYQRGYIKLPKGVKNITKGGKKKLPKGVYTKETKRNYTKETIQKMQNTISESLKEKPEKEKEKAPANNIEFDFELWSWHGIDDDIKDRWAKIFPHVEVEIELNKIRVHFKKNPKLEKVIEKRFNSNYAIYIFDWLVRAEKYIKDKEN